ncbi:unnamed protein product (macronuclear) [Paramecium tetraurelia]|uniref:Cyclic nucleotide-binding domain-containing protein n=1 Tax=Paramecium tetraurelia TaxID=5888 RepID=A0BDK7_PARTE|nr:uncharacterized protein GSPATT00027653001 [Paramecium tetraurelia]CAK56624.1 unnamed protein product [Paramecium tetraurelia]|eukprot:XP_001424022.1 hypothetical protein (macronuclear) [Paramecium tetraurelia strain d4-2]
MKKRESPFLCIDQPIYSQNITSPRFEELLPIYSNDNEAEQTIDEALKHKRKIFDSMNFRALNDGHKGESSEDDDYLSSVSDNRYDQESARSRTNTFIRNQRIANNQYNNQGSNRKAHTGLIIDSRFNQQVQGAKSCSRIDKYQSFVQQFELEEVKLRKTKEPLKQKSYQTNELSSKRNSRRKEGKIGLNNIWAVKGFIIIRLVSRFIQQLKTKTETIKFKLMTRKIFSIIGDLSSNFEYILISRQIKQKPSLFLILKYNFQKRATRLIHCLEYGLELLSRIIIVIRPDSKFKIVWDILLLLFIVMNIFYIPINISFNIQTQGVFEYLFDLLPSWIFIAEIIINFNTAYYDKGLMHEDRKSIVKHYLKDNFFWDLVVVIPFLMSNMNIPFVRYTLLFRLTRLTPLMQNIEEILNLEENIQIVVDLLKLIFFLVLTGHFCGCAWHFVALTEYESFGITDNWLTHYDRQAFDYHWFDRYIISLYWSVITTVTVGYGDIVPVTTFERIFVIVVTLLLCGVFGYCISNIGNIFKQMSDKKTTYKFKLRQIHSHIRKRGLNLNLSLKVKKYFEYFFQLEQEEDSHAEIFINQLTKHLREEVLTDLYSNTLKKSRFLRENFKELTINNLCQFVKEKKVLPEEVLYSRFDQPTKIWFVLSGALEFVADHKNENEYYEATETFLNKVNSGAVLGEREFITQQPYEYKVRALRFTQMAYIDYEDFINVISESDQEYEIFCMKRDRLLFDPQFKGTGNVCEVCGWTHNFIQCPFVFLQPNINKIASSFKTVRLNNRLKFPYRQSMKSRTREALNSIQEGALKLLVENITEQQIIQVIIENIQTSTCKKIELDSSVADEISKNLQDSPIITNGEIQKAFQKKSTKTLTGGMTTDLKDITPTHELKKSLTLFQKNQFGKEKYKAFQVFKKEILEKETEALEQQQSQIYGVANNQIPTSFNNKLYHKALQSSPRRSCNFDELNNFFLSQKFGNLTYQLDQDKYLVKQLSRTSEQSDMKESLIKKQIENQERRMQIGGERRRKKRKTTLQLGQQLQRKINQSQQVNLSPSQQQKQQLFATLDQKLGRVSIRESKKMGQANPIPSITQIDPVSQSAEYIQENYLQQKILDIVHPNQNIEIDCCKSTLVYFPEFNIDEILKKITYYYSYVKGVEKKMYKRSKSNRNPFERIRPSKNVSMRSFHNNSRLQQDEV